MAKLKLRIPTLDAVPAEQRAFYRQMESGGFILDHETDADGFGIDNLASLRGKLDEAQRDAARAKQKIQGFSKADGSLYTAEEIQALVAQSTEHSKTIETLRDKTKTDEQKIAAMVADATKPLHTEIAKYKGQIDRYRSSSHKAERDRVVAKALDVLKPQDRWKGLIAAEIARHIEIREGEDGSLSHVLLHPETGKPRMSSLQGRDGPMDIAEFASGAELRKQFGDCLRGDGKKGADITQPADERGAPQVEQNGRDVWLTREQANNFSSYEAAKAQASKQGGEVRIQTAAAPAS